MSTSNRPDLGQLRPKVRSAIFVCLASLSLFWGLALSGCASYSEEIQLAQTSIASGNPEEAIRVLNTQLEVDNVRQVPKKMSDNDTLILLERATLLQALGNFDMSARDMVVIDQHLEWLDIDGLDAADIGKYLYSDDVTDYRAPPYERLMLNTLNMINFLGRQDLEGARVEARRFTIMEGFYLDQGGKALMPGLLALGNYLGGAAFEASRDYDMAARYYSRAWHFGIRSEDLRQRLMDLYRVSGYSGREIENPLLDRMREDARSVGSLTWAEYQARHQLGDTLVVVQYGMAPYKSASRVPAQLALTSASSMRGRHGLSPRTRARTASMIASGSIEWINFPELSEVGLPQRSEGSASLSIDGRSISLFQGMNLKQQVELEWQRFSGPLMAAALTRMMTRAAIGQAGRVAAQATQSGNGQVALIGALGWLAATGVEAGLGAADTPDTRGWTTLPAYIRIARTKLTRGLHSAQITIDGRTDRQTIPVWPDRLNIANFSRLR